MMLIVASFILTSCNNPATNGNITTNSNSITNGNIATSNNANANSNINANSNVSSNTSVNSNTNANSNTTSSANTESDVRKLLGELEAALSKNDAAALDKIYSDDYTIITTAGEVQTKAQRLDSIKSGDLKFETIKFEDVKIQSYGDAAVVTARSIAKSTYKGKEQPGDSMTTIVFAKTKDGWRVVHGHPSQIEAKK